jgi:hypothetical protein
VKHFQTLILLAVLSIASGVLTAKMSFIGKVGIQLFFKEYQFLKVWWQGALIFALVMLVYKGLVTYWFKQFPKVKAVLTILLQTIWVTALLYMVYIFTNDKSLKLMGFAFHCGMYLYPLTALLLTQLQSKHSRRWPTNSNNKASGGVAQEASIDDVLHK